MHVLHELVCGIRGAELGSVDIYARGTSTRVTYYTSFEGDGSTTPTSGTTLDANGGGEFYVNETVDVVVRDSGGVEVRRFTSAPAASAVEVISQSFTGTDYDSAATGVSKPINLKSVLDLWKTNSGSIDWKVPIGGVATTLNDAFAAVGGIFINVKATTYGALGDGTTDDTAAIQEALDAAETAGGGTVFFPAGTYKTTAALTVAAGVSLLGLGPAASILKLASSTLDVLTMEAATTTFSRIEGLRVTYSLSQSAGTPTCINATAGRKLRIENCSLGQTAGLNGPVYGVKYDGAASTIFATNTTFTLDANAGRAISASTTTQASAAHIWVCSFTFNSATHGGTILNLSCGSVLGNDFNFSGVTSSGTTVCAFGIVTDGQVQAFAFNTVRNADSNVSVPTGIASTDTAYGSFIEIGNKYDSDATQVDAGGAAAKSTYYGQRALNRERGKYYVLSNAAAVSVSPAKYATIEIERTNTDVQTVTFLAAAGLGTFLGPTGMDLSFVYNNVNHASPTGTITMANVEGMTTFTVNALSYSVYFIRCIHVDTSSKWVLVGSSVNQTI